MQKKVRVYMLSAPYPIDKLFTYLLPEDEMFAEVKRGSILSLPFGKGNRPSFGVVWDFAEDTEPEVHRLKAALSVVDKRFALSEKMLALALFMKEHTFCTMGDAVHAMIPAPVFSHDGVRNLRTERIYTLQALIDEVPLRSTKQKEIVAYLHVRGEVRESELRDAVQATPMQLRTLTERGVLSCRAEEVIRDPYAHIPKTEPTPPIHLQKEQQQQAYETLSALSRADTAKGALLYGVTGSGKTKVMMRLMDDVLAEGRGVILMVPEISLTPRTVELFCARYGSTVAVIHSSLSAGERFDAWRRILYGEAKLVIGTRSAVFAPVQNLGLILLDEEHEHTYKSDVDPKYHARDIAAFRAGQCRALMVLASATPSLESFYKAQKGIYTLVELRQRYGGNPLPTAEIVDMREELRAGNTSSVSRRLAEEIRAVRARGEQSILFLNRRGYHAYVECRSCGEVLTCPNCSISLTYHADHGGFLFCHSCGFKQPPVRLCAKCGSEHVAYTGIGTQKAEQELTAIEEGIRIMRMDADTTGTKHAYDRMLTAFRSGEADLLLGTQMVTKGHDFPKVSLVGVLLADASLYVSDFRASERTFSLITQVIGRAGRSETKGRALIQTMSPHHRILELACKQDYDRFYAEEIRLRQSLTFPPFCDIAVFTLSSEREAVLDTAAKQMAARCAELAKTAYQELPLILYGPMEAETYKSLGRFRQKLVIKCRLTSALRNYFHTLLCEFGGNGNVSVSLDINPL